jgi:hypothetical protein
MDVLPGLFQAIDSLLIAPYRWPGHPVIGWWLGTSILAIWTALLGRLTIALVFRVNRRYIEETVREMDQRHHQSINALKSGDRSAYKGINKLANEAFGKSFFMQIAMASASLWPLPLALAWLQLRFGSVDFPLPVTLPVIGNSVSYPFIFIPLYILARILLGKIKCRRGETP